LKYFLIIIWATLISSCTTVNLDKAVEEFKNMPASNYDYIIQPQFQLSKEASEEKFKALYNAEEIKIGAAGRHSFDKETKAQIQEQYWLQAVLLNSDRVVDIRNEMATKTLSKEIAQKILDEITNSQDYDKIEIMLMQQWNDGQVKSIKNRVFFTLPNLEDPIDN